MALEVVRVINEPVSSNCFLLFNREVNNDCLVVDPGFSAEVYRVDS